ncbi:MAG: L-threonylcarbamoyladenylate synthase [Butyrivibrio sp.]|nr:L-threonylcarbamoyladenylate synthase [Butyrivibrio sp.]
MDTIIEKITGNPEADAEIIRTAAGIIKNGGLVAFPTETVYGLGGDAFDKDAASKIYAAKGRPSDNPLIVHIAKTEDLSRLCDEVPPAVYALAESFWPGPLTVIVRKNKRIPDTVTGGLDTVAVRLPNNPTAVRLIEESQTFIAAPSANLSGRPSPTSARHVTEDLAGRIDMIIDGGDIEIGLESTIVDMTGEAPVLLRPGFVTEDMLCGIVGEVLRDPALMSGVSGDVKPKAPGMKYRHYAPRAEMTLVEGESDAVADKIRRLADEAANGGKRVGIMASSESAAFFDRGEVISLGSRENIGEIAKNLFGALREFDRRKVDIIYAEAFSREGMGNAVMNRLLKAAGHRVIKV